MSIKEVIAKKNNKFHLRFLVVSTILIGLICFGVYSIYSNKYEQTLKLAKTQKEELITKQLTYLLEIHFKINQNQINNLEIEKIARGSDINYILVTNPDDSVLINFHFDDFGNIKISESVETGFKYGPDDVASVSKTIEAGDSQTVNLYCQFLRIELNSKIYL